MVGRFPLYTDADVNGPVVDALIDHGWDVVRAIDTFPEGTDDDVHFAHAAREGRVMVGNDIDVKLLAERWRVEQRSFRGLVWWPREQYARMKPGEFTADTFVVHLEDGRSLTVPLEWFPRLRDATPEQRIHYEMMGHGLAIHWPDLDEDISVPRLFGLAC